MASHLTRRCSRALVAPILAVLVLSACERTEVDGIGSYTPGDAAPPQRDVAMGSCSIGEWGWVTGSGTVENGTDDVATYEVVVGFDSGEVRAGQASTWIRDLGPSQVATFSASTHLGEGSSTMTDCAVITINRWGAETRPGT